MAQELCVVVGDEDRARLEAIIGDRNRLLKHTHQEFIRFLDTVERAVPAGKLVHAVLDNYATLKHPKVKAWLDRHPRWVFHFTPTSGSWLNAVESLSFFSEMTRQRIRRGVFHSIADLSWTPKMRQVASAASCDH